MFAIAIIILAALLAGGIAYAAGLIAAAAVDLLVLDQLGDARERNRILFKTQRGKRCQL